MLVWEIAREKIKRKNNRMSKRGGGGQTDRERERKPREKKHSDWIEIRTTFY